MPSTVTFCFPTCPQQWFRHEWTVIPARSCRILTGFQQNLKKWPESHEFAGIRWTHFSDAMFPDQICSFPTSLGPKKIRNRERKKKNQSRPDFAGFRRDFQRNHCLWSPESLLRAFWKKKIWKAYIERNWNFGGAHCEFLNISGRIEKHPKLQGANLYFPLKKKNPVKLAIMVKWLEGNLGSCSFIYLFILYNFFEEGAWCLISLKKVHLYLLVHYIYGLLEVIIWLYL